MENRPFAALGQPVSAVGIGTWQLGIDRDETDPDAPQQPFTAAVETGVTLIDTADVYGDGRSERFVGRFLATRPKAELVVATRWGRRVPPDDSQLQSRQLPPLERSLPGEPWR